MAYTIFTLRSLRGSQIEPLKPDTWADLAYILQVHRN